MEKKLRALLVKENELPVEVEIPNTLNSLQIITASSVSGI